MAGSTSVVRVGFREEETFNRRRPEGADGGSRGHRFQRGSKSLVEEDRPEQGRRGEC